MDPSPARFRWQTEWPLWVLLLAMATIAAVAWNMVPDQMPVHWNSAGEVDRFGSRAEGLLLFPGIGVLAYLVLLAAPRIDPARANYAAFSGAYYVVRVVTLVMMLALQLVVMAAARGAAVDMRLAVPLMVGPLFIVMGTLMPHFRHNWFVGIRTPWTLTSAYAWERTHAVGGKLFIGLGLLLMIAALVREQWYLKVFVGVAVTLGVGLLVYSYVAWSRDPDRRQ